MTHASQLSPEELSKRRSETARKASYGKVMMSQICPKTRGGVVVVQSAYLDKGLTAYLFRPTQINRYYATHKVASAHDALGMLGKLSTDAEAKKKAKAAPHTLQVGDVLVEIMSYTIRRATFYQVVGIPHPKKVDVVLIPQHYVSGDWMSGEVMPLVPETAQLGAGKTPITLDISMESGEPRSRVNSITSITKWDNRSICVHSD